MDQDRSTFLRDHLAATADAVRLGADVRGFFAWSLIDNFEWASGYTMRFGLVHVDFPTGKRTPRQSMQEFSDAAKQLCADSMATQVPRSRNQF